MSTPAPGTMRMKSPVFTGLFTFPKYKTVKKTVKMDYVLAKLHKPKTGNDWYVYYSVRNPLTGKMQLFKERDGINRIKNISEKKNKASILIDAINNNLKAGHSPFISKDEEKETKEKNRQDLFWWFDEKIKHEEARGDSGYYNCKNIKQVKKRLIEFKSEILLSELDYKLLKDFEAHLLKKDNSLNNISFIMDKIKAVLKGAINSGDIPYHKNPFIVYKAKTTKINSKRITFEQLTKLASIELTNKSEDLARDMYVFSFYQAGMRFGDICRAKKEWFKLEHSHYTMNKSKNDRVIKVMPEVDRILKKYSNTPGEYIFDTKVNWDEASKSIDIKNTFYNNKLKKACEAAEIPKITFHTSRHSIADLAKTKGLDIHTTKELLGHSKVATTERYMKRFHKEQTDKAMDTLFEPEKKKK